MALCIPGPVVSALSGTVGGVNFANAKSGTVLRTRAVKCDRRSKSQLWYRAAFAAALKYWQEMSTAQKLVWRVLASNVTFPDRFGHQRHISGYQVFLHCNIPHYATYIFFRSTPVLPFHSYSFTTLSAVFSAGGAYTITYTPSPTVGSAPIYGARSFSISEPQFWSGWNLIGHLAAVPSPQDITARYKAAFGALQEGEWAAIRTHSMVHTSRGPDLIAAAVTGP